MTSVDTEQPGQSTRWILAATVLASSMAFIDASVVNVALPALQISFQTGVAGLQWVVESYTLLLTALMLTGGSLGDRYGRREVFGWGVILFTGTSIACGLSPNIAALIVSRALQGVGAALLIPGSLSLITERTAPGERGKAIGTWSSFSAMTMAIGPALGGWIIDHTSWRWVFFLNCPLGLAVLLIMWRKIPTMRQSTSNQADLDVAGMAFVTCALAAMTIGLIEGSGHARIAWSMLSVASLCLLGFIYAERNGAAPMLPGNLLRSKTFSIANIITFCLYAALIGFIFLLPLNLISVQHYSATAAGAALLPLIGLVSALSRWAGGLNEKLGPRIVLTAGTTAVAAGFFVAGSIGVNRAYWAALLPSTLLLGAGMAFCVAPLTTTVMNSVSTAQAGIASGVNNAVTRLGGLLAVAIFGSLLVHLFSLHLGHDLAGLSLSESERKSILGQANQLMQIYSPNETVRESMRQSFAAAFRVLMWACSALALLSGLFSQMLSRDNAENNTP